MRAGTSSNAACCLGKCFIWIQESHACGRGQPHGLQQLLQRLLRQEGAVVAVHVKCVIHPQPAQPSKRKDLWPWSDKLHSELRACTAGRGESFPGEWIQICTGSRSHLLRSASRGAIPETLRLRFNQLIVFAPGSAAWGITLLCYRNSLFPPPTAVPEWAAQDAGTKRVRGGFDSVPWREGGGHEVAPVWGPLHADAVAGPVGKFMRCHPYKPPRVLSATVPRNIRTGVQSQPCELQFCWRLWRYRVDRWCLASTGLRCMLLGMQKASSRDRQSTSRSVNATALRSYI